MDNTKLVQAGLTLRALAPEAWGLFVEAVGDYAAQARDDMLRCEVLQLSRGQGRATMAAEIHQVLRDTPTLAERKQQLKDRNHGRAPGFTTG